MSTVDHAEHALALFDQGLSCSQAVVGPWAEELGLDPVTAAKAAAGFSGGMRQGQTCGAVAGAVMVLGLALGDDTCVTSEGRAGVLAAVADFAAAFRERVGALDCPGVLGMDLRDPEAKACAIEQGLFESRCTLAVRTAAELLELALPPGRKAGQ